MSTHETLCEMLRELDVPSQIDAGTLTTAEVFEACRAVAPRATNGDVTAALRAAAVEDLRRWCADDPEDDATDYCAYPGCPRITTGLFCALHRAQLAVLAPDSAGSDSVERREQETLRDGASGATV